MKICIAIKEGNKSSVYLFEIDEKLMPEMEADDYKFTTDAQGAWLITPDGAWIAMSSKCIQCSDEEAKDIEKIRQLILE